MEINYDQIITKANERAEKLKDLQAYSADAEKHAHNMLSGMLYFANLLNRVEALDDEGRAMLKGVPIRARLIGGRCSNWYSLLTSTERNNEDTAMVLRLVEALK